MNAVLNIQVRVAAQQANAALKSVAGSVAAVNTAAAGGRSGGLGKMMAGMGAAGSHMVKFGKNVQWTGQQLMYNLTLPLALAGGAAFKWAMDNERAMTQVRKVYGDLGMSSRTVKEETDALGRSFELLSNKFGVHQDEVIEIGAAWAAAGSSGVGLAKSVKNTLEAMSVGDMGAEEAFEALITVQATYGLTSDQLREKLAQLNVIENETAIRFKGLIDVMSRSGGAARTAGIGIEFLSSMAAAMVPQAATASQAGNALRTMISRITAPTKDAIDMFQRMGISITDSAWANVNAEQKVLMLAEAFGKLSQGQKNVVSATVASRWQVSRFNEVMEDIASGTGNFAKAMDITSGKFDTLAIYTEELNTVLASNPKRFEIMTNVIRNAMTDAILPMIPTILALVTRFAQLIKAFSGMDHGTKQMIIMGLVFLALAGPILKVVSLIGILGGGLLHLGGAIYWVAATAVPFLVTALKGILWQAIMNIALAIYTHAIPAVLAMTKVFGAAALAMGLPWWGLAAIIAAVVLAIIALLNDDLRSGIWDAIQGIARGLAQLPGVFVQVLQAVGRVIGQMMVGIVDMLSYLNPFARHSPSLVDNVRAGVGVILDEYGRLSSVSATLLKAAAAHQRFKEATAGGREALRKKERNEQREDIVSFSPTAGPALDGMFKEIDRLEGMLPGLQAQIDQQEAAVRDWTAALDRANATLEAQQDHLSVLRDRVSDLTSELSEAEEILSNLANTPITGMRAMEDAAFDNEMAQKRLKLAMMDLEDAAGGSLDELKSKMAALRGEQELLMGEKEDLRLAGAGSDILSTYDDQIKALQDQETAAQDILKPIKEMQTELEKLQREAERMDLVKSITFDPQVRQIDQLVNGMQELPFDQIISQIGIQQGLVEGLTQKQKEANQAVEEQEDIIRRTEGIRDTIATQLDTEKDKLSGLRDSYAAIEDQIRNMTQAINEFAQSAKQALDEANRAKELKDDRSTAEKLFDAGGDYEIPGGDAIIGREGALADIEAFNKDLEKQLADLGIGLGKMDIFGPFKEQLKERWKSAWEWIKDKGPSFILGAVAAVIAAIVGWPVLLVGALVAGLDLLLGGALSGAFSTAIEWLMRNLSLEGLGNIFSTVVGTIVGVLGGLVSFIGTILVGAFNILRTVVSTVWSAIQTAISAAWGFIQPIWQGVIDFINTYLVPIFQLFQGIAEIVFVMIGRAIEAWWKLVSGIFGLVVDFLEGTFRLAWEGFQVIVEAVWGAIQVFIETWWRVISTLFGAIIGFVGGVFTLAWRGFQAVVEVVWRAIQAVIQTVWGVVSGVFGTIVGFLGGVFSAAWNGIKTTVSTVWTAIQGAIEGAWGVISGVFNTIDNAIRTTLTNAFNFLKDNVVGPVFTGIGDIIRGAINGMMGAVETGINFFISAFNTLAGGVNRVAGFLNIDVKVGEMEKVRLPRLLAEGGVIPTADGRPGVYSRARAIVGEGNSRYPEYVIPTDPRYRDRARALHAQAAEALAQKQKIPETDEIGGFGPIGWAVEQGKKAVGGVAGAVSGVAGAALRNSAKAIFAPIMAVADGIINKIPIKLVRQTARSIKDEFYNWVTGADSALPEQVAETTTRGSNAVVGNGAVPGTGGWRRIVEWLFTNQPNVPFRVTSHYRPGDPGRHGRGLAVDLAGGQRGRDTPQLHAIWRALLPIAGTLNELIYSGPGAVSYKNGRPHAYSAAVRANHHDHVHAALRAGGVVKHQPGGTLLRIAEGGRDERIQVLPLRPGSGDGEGRTINFYGDLEFPNIRTGDDAEAFLRNLEAMVD